jgi:polyphosphate kinase
VVGSGDGKARKPAKSKVAPRSRSAGRDGAGARGRAAGLDGPTVPGLVPGHDGLAHRGAANSQDPHAAPPQRLGKKLYEAELYRLQAELVKMQEWVRTERARIVVIFEGRDAAGKGSTIKRVTAFLNPRVAQIVALPAPTERERTEWYFQRYVENLPAGGQIVLFDRSWYNRAGVERVMGFCTKEEYGRFLHQCPIFERLLVEDGILLRKYWFSVSDDEQEQRFRSRLEDPMRRWKLSPMDLESVSQWENYSRAKDEMFVHTDIPEAPWFVVESDDKRRARINMIAHLLSTVPYHDVQRLPLSLPPRPAAQGYVRAPRELQTYVPDHAAVLERQHRRKRDDR